MFGNGYTAQEYNKRVEEGDYWIQLGMPQDVVRNGYNIREIPIKIKDHPDVMPDTWSWFERPSNPEEAKKWDQAMTRNADAFGVHRGDFNPRSWAGKVGLVHIGKDSKGYMKVKYAIAEGPASSSGQSSPYGPPPQGAPAQPPAYQAPAHQAYQAPAQQSYQAQRQAVPAQEEFDDDDVIF